MSTVKTIKDIEAFGIARFGRMQWYCSPFNTVKLEKKESELPREERLKLAYRKYRQIEQAMWDGKNDCHPGAMVGCYGFCFTLREKPQN